MGGILLLPGGKGTGIDEKKAAFGKGAAPLFTALP
jgi:hypothetical protein